jgi:hypothetical protein
MESKEMNLTNLQTKPFDLEKTSSRIELGGVFAERNPGYLNEFNLFIAHFNCIPNVIEERRINCKKANTRFKETFKAEIKDSYFNKRYFKGNRTSEYDDIFYFLYDDLIVDFDTNYSTVRFLFRKTDITKVEKLLLAIKKFRERKERNKPEVSLLYSSAMGIRTKSLEISKPKLNIEDNYNDDFKEIHKTILRRLSKKNDKGLVLLHGKPGTGKTSYI